MKALKRIWDEVIGLFIDDGAYAAAIVVWLMVIAGLVWLTPYGTSLGGPLLFVGLAAILLESAMRRARKSK